LLCVAVDSSARAVVGVATASGAADAAALRRPQATLGVEATHRRLRFRRITPQARQTIRGRAFGPRLGAAQLSSVAERIVRDIPTLSKHGVAVVSVVPDFDADVLQVGVNNGTNRELQVLRQRYGRRIVLGLPNVIRPTSRTHGYPPIKGGLKIYDKNEECTSGFVAGTAPSYLITAGHCDEIGTTWHHNAQVTLGKMAINSWYGTFTTTADAGAIRLGSTVQTSNFIYADDSRTTWPITGVHPRGTFYVSEPYCYSGFRGQLRCGEIAKPHYTASIPYGTGYKTVVDQLLTSLLYYPGDSGAPAFLHHIAYGIVSSDILIGSRKRSEVYGMVSKAARAETALGISIRTS